MACSIRTAPFYAMPICAALLATARPNGSTLKVETVSATSNTEDVSTPRQTQESMSVCARANDCRAITRRLDWLSWRIRRGSRSPA
jgi:hypothetical protein